MMIWSEEAEGTRARRGTSIMVAHTSIDGNLRERVGFVVDTPRFEGVLDM